MRTAPGCDAGTFVKSAERDSEREKLAREARTLTACAHPGVVRLVATHGGDPPAALVLDRVGTRTLGDCHGASVKELARVGAAVATTLDDLHHLGYAHGAMCAEHVLLDDDGRPVLCSFGRATAIDRRSDPGADAHRDVAALAILLIGLLPRSADRRLSSSLTRAASQSRRSGANAGWLGRRLAEHAETPAHAAARRASGHRTGVARVALVMAGTAAGSAVVASAVAAGCAPSSKAPRTGPVLLPLPPDSGGSASRAASPGVRSHLEPRRSRPSPTSPPSPPRPRARVTVNPGDSLWSIAERIVSGAQPDPSIREVARYWRNLIQANRSRLPEPSDPSLIFPGDELLVPPLLLR